MTKTLLVADDSITIQKIVALTFAGDDVAIEAVTNGDEAMQKVRTLKPDIVLADVFMPGRNGYELCAAIKADPLLIATKVILLVGTFEPFDESEAVRVKCDAHIYKPFDTGELARLVHSFPTGSAPVSPELVSDRARESFLGAGRILDLLDPGIFEEPKHDLISSNGGEIQESVIEASDVASGGEDVSARPVEEAVCPEDPGASPKSDIVLSQDTLEYIIEQVVRRMSNEVVREVAWEVIPEISEELVRQCFDQRSLIDDTHLAAPHENSN